MIPDDPEQFSDAWYYTWFDDIEISGRDEGVELLKEFEQEIRADERSHAAAPLEKEQP